MAKHRVKGTLQALEDYDPATRKLGMERFTSGKQVFDYRTHKLRPHFRDESQGRGALLWALHYAKKHGKELRLYASEKRLLAKIFKDGTILALAACLAVFLGITLCGCGWFILLDADGDGIPDVVEFLAHAWAFQLVK